MPRISLILALCSIGSLVFADPARAENPAPARIALFPTSTEDAALHELATALDPVLVAELERNGRAQITERPAIDLPATQLALDCLGETAECLRTVTDQLHVEGLLAAVLRRAGSETVVTLLYFDARGVGAMKGVTRKRSGDDVEQDLLDGVPAMIDELLGASDKASAATDTTAPEAPDAATAPDQGTRASSLPVGAIVLGAGGLVLIGVGSAFGLAAKSSEDDYAALEPSGPADAKVLQDELDSAKTQALLSNVGIGVGAAAVVGSVLWWVLASGDHDATTANDRAESALTPILGPRAFGLVLRGTLAGNP